MADNVAAVVGDSKQEGSEAQTFRSGRGVVDLADGGPGAKTPLTAGIAILGKVQHQFAILKTNLDGVLAEHFHGIGVGGVRVGFNIQSGKRGLSQIGDGYAVDVGEFKVI